MLDPEVNDIREILEQSSPHPGRPLEVSRGIFAPKHFAGPLGGPGLLFLKIVAETPHRSLRWRAGVWMRREDLASEIGRPVGTLRKWLAAAESAGYIQIERGFRGIRIKLTKRIFYRNGTPQVTGAVGPNPDRVSKSGPDRGVGRTGSGPEVGPNPDRGRTGSGPGTPSGAASSAASVTPSSDFPSENLSSGIEAQRSPVGARFDPDQNQPAIPCPPDVAEKIAQMKSRRRP